MFFNRLVEGLGGERVIQMTGRGKGGYKCGVGAGCMDSANSSLWPALTLFHLKHLVKCSVNNRKDFKSVLRDYGILHFPFK